MTSANAASVNDNGAGAGAASSAGVSSAAPAGFGPRLAGKVAFVTGGAGGIGAAIVRLFVAHGARVVVADRDADAGYALEKELDAIDQPRRKKISFVRMDVAQEDAWQKAMQQVESTYGRLDVLVNCAGLFTSSGSVGETATEDFDRILATNVRGTFLGVKYGSELLRATREPTHDGGAIINVSSVAGQIGVAQMAAYCTSKAAVQQLTKVAALDLARHHPPIRCTAICPIWVRTPMLDVVESQLGPIKDEAANPMRKILSPQDVAYSALFLASAEARFITGTEIVIDGGYTAQ